MRAMIAVYRPFLMLTALLPLCTLTQPAEPNVPAALPEHVPYRANIVLAAVGRSGSTFVEHLLTTLPQSFLVDEPDRRVSEVPKAMHARKESAEAIRQYIEKVYRNIFTCKYLSSPELRGFRGMVFDRHSCGMSKWIPTAFLSACMRNMLPPAILQTGSNLCQKSPYRIIKIIRFRNGFDHIPQIQDLAAFRFIHLVRRPIHVALSRFRAGWGSATPTPEIVELLAHEAKIPAEKKQKAAYILTGADFVCVQQLHTEESAVKSLSEEERLTLKFEDIRGNEAATIDRVFKFVGFQGTLSVDVVQKMANQSYMKLTNNPENVKVAALLSDGEYENYLLRYSESCRALYRQFGYKRLLDPSVPI